MYYGDSGAGAAVIVVVLLIWIGVGGGVGWLIGRSKGRAGLGFVLGMLLTWIGWIIIAVIAPSPEHLASQGFASRPVMGGGAGAYRECPHCKEQMRRDAKVCPHCHSESSPWEWRDGHWFAGGHWLDEATNTWRPAGPPSISTGPA